MRIGRWIDRTVLKYNQINATLLDSVCLPDVLGPVLWNGGGIKGNLFKFTSSSIAKLIANAKSAFA